MSAARRIRHPVVALILVLLIKLVNAGSPTEATAENGFGEFADDLVVIVASGNPVMALTRAQVEDIFMGRTTRFPDGRRAQPIDQSEGAPVRIQFNEQVLERTAAQVRSQWASLIFTGRARAPRVANSSEDVIARVAVDTNAVAYVERRYVTDSVRIVYP